MPLAEGCGAVAVLAENFGDTGLVLGQYAVITGEAVGQLHNDPRVDRVMVAPSEERGPCGGAEGGRMEAVIAYAFVGQPL